MSSIHLHEAGEDYLEAILELQNDSEGARSIDVAKRLGVSRPSVNKAMGILKEAGMVEQQPYGLITLTESGKARAEEVSRRHLIIKRFLVEVLGVDSKTGDIDACRMEHVISDVTMSNLVAFVENHLKDSAD